MKAAPSRPGPTRPPHASAADGRDDRDVHVLDDRRRPEHAGAGHAGYVDGEVATGSFILTLLAFAVLTVGGWLGGAITYVHGMRVLNLVEEPAARAASPVPHAEKVDAEA
jgi:hypothetical protein